MIHPHLYCAQYDDTVGNWFVYNPGKIVLQLRLRPVNGHFAASLWLHEDDGQIGARGGFTTISSNEFSGGWHQQTVMQSRILTPKR